ncbi:MAG: hypothetical protein NTU79_04055 [Planctomycetota bacterium]|nr:hypothetical protein [Planctomycetota bacterium]
MSRFETWSTDWQDRIKLQVQDEGYCSISTYLKAWPNIPLFKVARRLGPEVAAVQLAIIYFSEAQNDDELKSISRDLLCRILHSNLRKGWKGGRHADRMMAGAYSEWLSTMELRSGLTELRRVAQDAWQALEKSLPAHGWLPENANDGRIVEAIDRGWENAKSQVE